MPKSQDDPQPQPASDRPKKKRRWPKVLLVLFLLLIALGFAINGPIARWLVGKVLTDQLAKVGLEGEVTVEGQLRSGFTLMDAKFEGEDSIARIKFDEVGVRYSLSELRDKKIQRLHGKGVELELNLKEKDEEPKKKPEFEKIAESLRKFRPLVSPVALDFERFQVTLNRPEKDPLQISFGGLTHQADTDTFQLKALASNALGENGLPEQDLTLTWQENGLQLSEVQILPKLAINQASLSYPPGEPIALDASVRAADANFDLAANETGNINLTMKDGPLLIQEVVAAFKPDLELGGSLSRLQVTAHNLWEDPDSWTARVELEGTDLKFPNGGELTHLTLRLTGDQDLSLTASAGTGLQIEASAPRPELKDRPLGEVWKNLPASVSLSTPSLHQTLRDLFAAIGKEAIDLTKIPEGALALEGDLTTGGEFGISPADFKWTFSEIIYQKKEIPSLQGTARLADGVAHATATLSQPRPEETLELAADWTLESKRYNAKLTVQLPDPAWIKPFLPGDTPDWKPTGPIAVTWNGQGALPTDTDAEPKHTGALEVSTLTLTAPEETTTAIALKGSYDWPGRVELSSLSVRNQDLWLEGALQWAGERFTINTLRLHDQTGPLAHLSGSLPLTTETLTPKAFFAQEEKIDLSVDANDLRLRRLAGLLPLKLPDGFAANLTTNLTVSGSPANLLLGGTIKATEVDTPGPEKLPLLSAELKLSTVDRTLQLAGEVIEPGGKIVALEGSLPLEINRLLSDPEEFKKLPIQARATITDFKLQRLQILAPPLAQAEGLLEADFRVGGTLNAPELSGGASVSLKRYPVPGAPFEELGESRLNVRLDGDRIAIDPSPFTAAGGTLVLSGTVGLAEGAPQFDLQVNADSFLVWRDDNVLFRTNGQLVLQGSMATATLRGDLGIIESLVYKDIEIIPIGIPATGAPKPKLPKFDRGTANRLAGIPKPFADWALNVGIATTDPILIRGNIATGQITAAARITGTIGNPRPQGTINLDRAEALLPLSKLTVRQGKVVLRPDQPFDPVIDVRGTTTVNNTRISLYLFGPVSNPKYDLFSDPPLPESEILTLIATGTTTGGLQDQDTATMKAFQFGVNELKRRLTKPGKDSLLQKFLKTLEVVDIRVGENDPFQNRKFTSATLQLNKFLFFSAAVDREGQTRGVVMFAPQPEDEEALGVGEEPGGPGKELRDAKIKVVGLRTIRPEVALGTIAGRLEYILDRPTNESRANDAAFLLERFLQQQGYTDPKVAASVPQPGRIVLAVEEGPRSSLGKIWVQGVTGDLFDGVREQMQAAHEGRTRLPGEDIPYLPENNATGIKNATALLNSEGYWSGVVTLHSAIRDPRTGQVALRLQVTPGPRYHLAAVQVRPGTPLREELTPRLSFLPGRVAKTENITLARSSVERFFRDRGYQNANVSMQATHAAGQTRLTFGATLGQVFKVNQVRIEGLERTDQSVVEGRFDQFPGQTYNREKIDDQIRKLYGTSAFAGIRVEENQQSNGTIDLTLHFREGKPDGYQVYAGVGSYEGFIIGAGYYHRNLRGNLWNLSTRAEWSGIGLLGEVSVTDPFFLGYDLRFTPRAFLTTRTYEGYKKFEGGAGVQLAWDINEYYSMAVEWTTSFVTLSADGLPNSEVGPNNYLLNVLGFSQAYDRRNDVATPTDGYYATLTTDIGLSLGERNVSFLRAEAHASVYEPVTEKSHVAVGGRAGVIVPSGSDTDLPVDLRYFLGGANSVRSFPARELGPEAPNGIPRGGESYWVANAEFMHSIIGPVNGVVFLDAGSLSRDHYDIFSGDIKYALGLGVRLNLPIGPVRLEYGRSLNPEDNEPTGTFHFAIGAAF